MAGTGEAAGDGEVRDEVDSVFREQVGLVRRATNPLVRAAIGTGPFLGGVSSLLGDWAANRQELRLRRFLISLAVSVRDIDQKAERKLDADYVHSEEFAACMESVLQEVARTADADKLDALRAFVLSAAAEVRPDVSWRDLFMQYMRQLSGVHVVVLGKYYEVQGGVPASDRLGRAEMPEQVPLAAERVATEFSKFSSILVRVACIDLANLGLLVDWRMLNADAAPVHTRYVLADSGHLFMRFLRAEWSN